MDKHRNYLTNVKDELSQTTLELQLIVDQYNVESAEIAQELNTAISNIVKAQKNIKKTIGILKKM